MSGFSVLFVQTPDKPERNLKFSQFHVYLPCFSRRTPLVEACAILPIRVLPLINQCHFVKPVGIFSKIQAFQHRRA